MTQHVENKQEIAVENQVRNVIDNGVTTCTVIYGDSREILTEFKGQADLIVTSPPYADARQKHYESIHPDAYVDWFIT